MSEILSKNNLKECINHSSLKGLDFITAGTLPPNPSELIISDNFNHTVKELQKIYDFIIIDNPPVGLVTDGISILQKADYPIYVLKPIIQEKIRSKRSKTN